MRYLSYLGRRRLIAREGLLGTTTTTTTTNKAADDCLYLAGPDTETYPSAARLVRGRSAVGPRGSGGGRWGTGSVVFVIYRLRRLLINALTSGKTPPSHPRTRT